MDDNDGRPDTGIPADYAPNAAPPEPLPEKPEPGQPDVARPERVPTGHAGIDEALERVAELDDMPVGEHVAVVEDIHRALQAALAEDED